MSAYDRVADYLAGMADAPNHKMEFTDNFIRRVREKEPELVTTTGMSRGRTSRSIEVDGVEMEKEALSAAERSLVKELSSQVKFTKNNFCDGFKLSILSRAKRNGGHSDLEKVTTIDLNFRGSKKWFLTPALSDVRYSSRESTMQLMDVAQQRAIHSVCNTLSSTQGDALNMAATKERLALPIDMRHMFMKMYLMLMDYNLAATSKSTDMEIDGDMTYDHYPRITQEARATMIMTHRIVIDSEGFTPSELGLLAISAKEYPSVWYAGDNIYTNCCMDADDLAIISSQELDMDVSLAWGSPDRLLQTIWSVACKTESVGCLMSAITTMRGKCKAMSDMFKRVKANSIQSMVPLSTNLCRSLGAASDKYLIKSTPGFISTSFSLITDLLYGMMYEASATCVVEELGGIGKALSSSTPTTNRTFNGLLRDHGLEHSDSMVNLLLLNWHSLNKRPITWSFGKYLKEYCVKLAEEMTNKIDIIMPQIMALMPFTHTPNTTWGLSRNWNGNGDILANGKDGRKGNNNLLAAVAFIMGVRPLRPRVFRNTFSYEELVMSKDEYQLAAESSAGCQLKEVRFWLAEDVGGRVDENEKTTQALFKTEYAGTKCSLVYHTESSRWVIPSTPDYQRLTSTLSKGVVPKAEHAPVVKPVTFGGALGRTTDAFEHLRSLGKHNKVMVDDKKRHIRVGSDGEASVTPYLMDGETQHTPLLYRPVSLKEGSEIDYAEILPAGDQECSIYAAMEDLKAHGFVSGSEINKLTELLDADKIDSLHDDAVLATIVNNLGFGLDIVHNDGVIERYPRENSRHIVTLLKEGENYMACVLGKGASRMKVSKVLAMETDAGHKEVVESRFRPMFG
jgi:hypothetical protein